MSFKELDAPPCPLCGGPLIARARNRDAKLFWGCERFPVCKGSEAYSTAPTPDRAIVAKGRSRGQSATFEQAETGLAPGRLVRTEQNDWGTGKLINLDGDHSFASDLEQDFPFTPEDVYILWIISQLGNETWLHLFAFDHNFVDELAAVLVVFEYL